jgi:ATP-dependent Zn protease
LVNPITFSHEVSEENFVSSFSNLNQSINNVNAEDSNTGMIISIVIGVVVVIALIAICVVFYLKRNRLNPNNENSDASKGILLRPLLNNENDILGIPD